MSCISLFFSVFTFSKYSPYLSFHEFFANFANFIFVVFIGYCMPDICINILFNFQIQCY